MATKHAVLNTSMIDYKNGNLQKTIIVPEGVTLDLGNVIVLKGYAEGQREVHEIEAPKKDTDLDALYIVTQVPVPKDERIKRLDQYCATEGQLVDVRKLVHPEGYEITAEGLYGTPKVGAIVEAQDGYKLKVVETATAGSTKIGEITLVQGDFYTFEI